MPQGTLWYQPIQRMFQGGTNTVPNARAFFYLAGTSSPVNVYADVGLTIVLTQPVVADANGVFVEIFLTPGTAYKVDAQTATGASLPGYPADNQLAIPSSSAGVSQTGTAGEAIAAGQPVYLSDGSGGKTAGQWYKGDATNPYSSSIAQVVGLAPAGIAVGASGTFVTAGQVGGLSVTPGTDYFIGLAGALTATAPANTRYLGRADSVSTLILQDKPGLLISPVVRTSVVTPAPGLWHGVCQGRLTLTSGVPVTTADTTSSTLFFTPYGGNTIGLTDGVVSQWTLLPFAELSLSVSGLTPLLPYDIFAYNNNGVVALRPPVPWASQTARTLLNPFAYGVIVRGNAAGDRYVGTVVTDGTSAIDTARQRYVWNYYNRVRRPLLRKETVASWTYNGAFRQANANALNQVEVVVGVQEALLDLRLSGAALTTGINVNTAVTIGEDSTTIVLGAVGGTMNSAAASNGTTALLSMVTRALPIGRHLYLWLEAAGAATTTWFGTGSGLGLDFGLSGSIDG